MKTKYFAIERNGECYDHMKICGPDDDDTFLDLMGMSFEEMKSYEYLDEFVVFSMDASNYMFQSEDEQTVVTLIDEDDIFVWSIIMGPTDDGDINYKLIDWNSDDKKYRYEIY